MGSRSEYHHELYECYKAANVCPYCGQRKKFADYVACEECIEKATIYRAQNAEKINAYNRNKYAELRAQGLCTRCKKPSDGQSRCAECREKRNKRERQVWKRRYRPIPKELWAVNQRKAKGLCAWCGKQPSLQGHKLCEPHYNKMLEINAMGREKSNWKAKIDVFWCDKTATRKAVKK